jgi:tetratricopeptide (TPR) repeat protein
LGRVLLWLISAAVGVGVMAAGAMLIWNSVLGSDSEASLTDVRSLTAAHQTAAALHEFAEISPTATNTPAARAVADELYASMCDPATGEPNSQNSATDVRRIARRLKELWHDSGGEDRRRAGEFALAAGLNEDSVTALSSARASGARPDAVLVPLALALLRTDHLEEMLATVRPEDATEPHRRAMLWTLRSRAQEGLDQVSAARGSLQNALKEEPTYLPAISRLGLLELRDRNTQTAGYLVKRAQNVAVDAPPTLRLAAEYAYATRDFAASATFYARLMEQGAATDYDPLPAVLGKARAQIYAGDLPAASQTLQKASETLNDSWVPYYQAMLAFRAGDYRRAAELAEPLVPKLPDYRPLDLLIGAAALANGYPATAVRHLLRYLDSDPLNDTARNLLKAAEAGADQPGSVTPVPKDQLLAALGFPAGEQHHADAAGGKL